MSRILIVDDKELMRDSVGAMLSREGHTVVAAADAKSALRVVCDRRPDLVLTDLKMPDMTGLDLLQEVRKVDEELPVILMTAFATVQTAIDAMKHGAFDYLTKPFDGDQLTLTVRRALDHARLVKENSLLKTSLPKEAKSGRGRKPMLIGESSNMKRLKDQISRIAPSHGTVLIMGESGAGKEVIAQTIHALSPRSREPMLAVNCAALSASLLESELFGHERGAFTGADKMRKGRFELANGGTLLLDEISEVPPAIQAKLLRVLQERAFERVGSSVTQKTDVRVVATTNRDLRQAVAEGRFRQDLYFRLHVLPIVAPPLRERLDDIPLLCEHFLELVGRREGRDPKRMTPEAIERLQRYRWPGNVRELFNICERASILAPTDQIDADLLDAWLAGPDATSTPVGDRELAAPSLSNGATNHASTGSTPFAPTPVQSGGKPLAEIEREVILATLDRFDGHRQKTASELGIGVRTLGLKLRKWKEERLVSEDV
ncbi:MAG: sigma-54-dependent transcriptional regulator [Phycisphaerales bacterium]